MLCQTDYCQKRKASPPPSKLPATKAPIPPRLWWRKAPDICLVFPGFVLRPVKKFEYLFKYFHIIRNYIIKPYYTANIHFKSLLLSKKCDSVKSDNMALNNG